MKEHCSSSACSGLLQALLRKVSPTDTVTINVDLSVGTIAYQKNGEDFMSSSPQGVTGPLRLLVALDWDTEAVTIAKSGPTNVRAHYY